MVSAAVTCLPAVVSLLLLAVLFVQISGVSLALTWPHRLCLLRVLLGASCCYKLSPFQAHWGSWHCTRFLWPVCLFTAHVGGGSSPLSCAVFLPLPLSHAFLLLVAGCAPRLLPSPAWPGLFIYSSWKDSPSPPSALRVPHPLGYVSLLFLLLITYLLSLLLSFCFFSRWGLVCPGGYADLAQVVCGSIVYHLAHLVRVFPSCLGAGIWRPGGPPGFSV
jgi:hypothetical protein